MASTNKPLPPTPSLPPASTATYHLFFALRFLQLGAVVITGFAACTLVWWHNFDGEKVPRELWAGVFVLTSIFLEIYIHSARTIHALIRSRSDRRHLSSNTSFNPWMLFCTSLISFIALIYAASAILRVPDINIDVINCNMSEYARRYGTTVEARNCAMVCDLVVAGEITIALTFLVFIFASVAVLRDISSKRRDDVEEGLTVVIGAKYSDFAIEENEADEFERKLMCGDDEE